MRFETKKDRRRTAGILLGGALLMLGACQNNVGSSFRSLLDNPLLDRRIKETPRQKVLRECRQESDRFRVACTHCHTTGEEAKIAGPERLLLTPIGLRTQIMRKSPTFGLHTQCSKCHMSKFQLTPYAAQLFGPRGKRFKDLEELKNQQVR